MHKFKQGLLLAFAIALSTQAQEARYFRLTGPVATRITGLSADGYLTWTNAPTNATFTVQVATALDNATNWADFVRIPTTNGVNTRRLIDFNPPDGMVWIPAGSFTMGSPVSEALRTYDEAQHVVTLTAGFYLGKYEVTQGQYLGVVGNNPSYFQTNDYNGNPISPDLNRPVEQVSWNDATNYCALLTQADRLAGRIPSNWRYRLPTESEWEYACRGGTPTAFHYGSGLYHGMANFYTFYEYNAAAGYITTNTSGIGFLGRTTTVGSYAANAFGLYDMHGNVWEWCQDWYGTYPTGTVIDPTGPTSGSYRVIRGGSWSSGGGNCRAAIRKSRNPTAWNLFIGFRVVLAPGQ